MKTTTENSTTPEMESVKEAGTIQSILKTTSSRSVRPMKSMVRSKSLKPQRIEISTKLRRKPIKA
jgi:hypothetical protein